MNVNQALRRLKIMLSSQMVFAEATLVDGVEVYTEGELEAGAILFVRAGEGVSEDPFAPAGMHETMDGKLIEVGENGEIISVEDKPAEEALEDDKKEEVAMEEVEVEVPEEVAALTEEVVALKKRFETMAAEPAAPRVKNTFASIIEDKNNKTEQRLKQLAAMRKSK